MKRKVILWCLLFFPITIFSQSPFKGSWQGKIEMANLRIVFHITNNPENTLQSTFDSPDQSAFGLKINETIIENDSIFLHAKQFNLSYKGQLINDSTIIGEMNQGISFPLTLHRIQKGVEIKEPTRPQTPQPPFPYTEKEVFFNNTKDNIQLSGTLTIPGNTNREAYPAFILISGSGPQDRDETIFGHKPFAVIADYFTRKGFAVLRYDDRGTGQSTGNFSTATTEDFAHDAEAALQYLKTLPEINSAQIGLIGHSEGGMIAPIVAENNPDIHFIILLAAPGIPIVDLMTEQNIAIQRSMGISEKAANAYGELYKQMINKIITNKTDESSLYTNLLALSTHWAQQQEKAVLMVLQLSTEALRENLITQLIKETSSPWMKNFLSYNPQPTLKNVKAKILALNGSKDIQVLAQSNTSGIKQTLAKGKSTSYEVKIIDNVNHLFQSCKLCSIQEYSTLDETISPDVLNIIYQWLKKEKIAP
ncbi:MAG: alpha/beta hydrolase [Ferruginibacter sp.]|nr:alpha/beta hydrolase [Ferruginibacter sp.]